MVIIRKVLGNAGRHAAAYKIAASAVMLLLIISGVGGFFAAVATGNQGNSFTRAEKIDQYQYATTRSTAITSTSSSIPSSTFSTSTQTILGDISS
jgi:hypothetical protein